MRKAQVLVGIALATTLVIAAEVLSSSRESVGRSRDHARLAETGALHRFSPQRRSVKNGEAPTISLTASDGTGLRLASLDARGVVLHALV